jgi:hypothetical protein
MLPSMGSTTLALVPTGTATVYFAARPESRNWKDLSERSTWGEPVATFTRNASILRSPDGFASDTFIFTAELVSSKTFSMNGRPFNFRDLIPHGITCFENGQAGSTAETGTCVATGN